MSLRHHLYKSLPGGRSAIRKASTRKTLDLPQIRKGQDVTGEVSTVACCHSVIPGGFQSGSDQNLSGAVVFIAVLQLAAANAAAPVTFACFQVLAQRDRKKMRKRDKHLLRGPQGQWSQHHRTRTKHKLSRLLEVCSCFRAITTEDFRKQGPSTAQVEASCVGQSTAFRALPAPVCTILSPCAVCQFPFRSSSKGDQHEMCMHSASQVSKDASGPSRRSGRKAKGDTW